MKAMLAAILLATATLHAGDYRADYAALKEKVGKDNMEKHLADWRKREPDNPDAWIHSANWALEQADSVAIRNHKGGQLPEGKYELELRDDQIVVIGADGKMAGDIVADPSRAGVLKAAYFLSEGLKKWPYRVDMYCGLATVYAKGLFWPEHLAALRSLVSACRRQEGKLRWCHNEPLTVSEEDFLADKLHSFALRQYEMENPKANQRFFEIAQLLVRSCPKSPKGYNDLAVYHGLSKDWKAAQPVLEKAVTIAPDDAVVWMNLGDNSGRLGKPDTARKAYQQVLELKTDDAMVKEAEARIKELDQPKR